jgi:hypothetical protein
MLPNLYIPLGLTNPRMSNPPLAEVAVTWTDPNHHARVPRGSTVYKADLKAHQREIPHNTINVDIDRNPRRDIKYKL